MTQRWDGQAARGWVRAAADLTVRAAPRIDAVNMFPVPDSDTGTNVRLTIDSGARRVAQLPGGASAARVARAFAGGALVGARGSSGVILSQWLAGFAAALPDEPVGVAMPDDERGHAAMPDDEPGRAAVPDDEPGRAATPGGQADAAPSGNGSAGPMLSDDELTAVIADALGAAAVAATAAVAVPAEGTVLTVARLVAQRARERVGTVTHTDELLGPVLGGIRDELARISAANPVLRAAHVVDAGACALLVVLAALDQALTGREPDAAVLDWLPAGEANGGAAQGMPATAWAGGAYEVMLLVRPDEPSGAGGRLRERLAGVGDSVAAVGDGAWWQVHVHTDDPAAAIEAAHIGMRSQVVVRLVEGAARHVAGAGSAVGLVVAIDEPGAARFLATGGAVVVVRCPEEAVAAEHLARAVQDTGAPQVVLVAGDDELAAPVREVAVAGVRIERVGAPDVLATTVAASAALGAPGDAAARADAAQTAVARLRAVDVDVWGDLATDAAALVDGAAGAAQVVTVQHGPGAYDDAVELREWLESEYPELDVVLVGPVSRGPRWRIGVD